MLLDTSEEQNHRACKEEAYPGEEHLRSAVVRRDIHEGVADLYTGKSRAPQECGKKGGGQYHGDTCPKCIFIVFSNHYVNLSVTGKNCTLFA